METRSRRPMVRRRHRLPREAYRGEIAGAFTICIAGGMEAFTDEEVVNTCLTHLRRASRQAECEVLVYCFMPEHLHVILRGTAPKSDLWRAITLFKQLSGYWLSKERPGVRWQGDFFDHVIRDEDELARQLRYIAENPVRRGLVADWRIFPFLGSDVYDLRGDVGPA